MSWCVFFFSFQMSKAFLNIYKWFLALDDSNNWPCIYIYVMTNIYMLWLKGKFIKVIEALPKQCQLGVPLPRMPFMTNYSWSAMFFPGAQLDSQFGVFIPISQMFWQCSWNSWMEEKTPAISSLVTPAFLITASSSHKSVWISNDAKYNFFYSSSARSNDLNYLYIVQNSSFLVPAKNKNNLSLFYFSITRRK